MEKWSVERACPALSLVEAGTCRTPRPPPLARTLTRGEEERYIANLDTRKEDKYRGDQICDAVSQALVRLKTCERLEGLT